MRASLEYPRGIIPKTFLHSWFIQNMVHDVFKENKEVHIILTGTVFWNTSLSSHGYKHNETERSYR